MHQHEITDEWIHGLEHNRRGEFGEAIAKAHFLKCLDEDESFVHSALEPYERVSQRRTDTKTYTTEVIRDDGIDNLTWKADLVVNQSVWHHSDTPPDSIKRTTVMEVKTGEYAELERGQKEVLGILNQLDDHAAVIARVLFSDDDSTVATVRYQTLKPDPNTNARFRLVPLLRD